jgi:hypothetical protein
VLMSRRSVRVIISALIPRRGIMAMLKIEMAPIVIPLLLAATPSVADVTSEVTRCQLEAENAARVEGLVDTINRCHYHGSAIPVSRQSGRLRSCGLRRSKALRLADRLCRSVLLTRPIVATRPR